MADVSTERLRKKIIEILKGADLSTLSAKKVRIKLQSHFDIDLSARKKEIDKMTMALIVELEQSKDTEEKEEKEEEEEEQENGKKSDSEVEEEEVVKEPPKKKSKSKQSSKSSKHKRNHSDDELAPLDNDDLMAYDEEQKVLKLSDEELAKRLQSFEETGRRTRTRAAAPKKKERKKKEGGAPSGYSRPCFLSADLTEIMGTDKLARNEVVKKMWEIVRERKLEDPKDRRFMICDEQLTKVFGRKRVQTFGMMKYLSHHIRDEKPSLESVINNSDIYDDEAEDD